MTDFRTLSHADAKLVYDRIGSKQDTQAFYEDRATADLRAHADFDHAHTVLELGCGTGRFAETLFTHHLGSDARYLGLDVSTTMVELARERLARFARAEVRQTDGSPSFDVPDESVDRVVSNYVLDLLSPEDIHRFVAEARRVLAPGGRLCVTGLGWGDTAASKAFIWCWSRLHRAAPKLVGGCRPLALRDYLDPARWEILHERVVVAWAVPSAVLVARPHL